VNGQPRALVTLLPGKQQPLPTVQKAMWTPELVWTFYRSIKIKLNCGPLSTASHSYPHTNHLFPVHDEVSFLSLCAKMVKESGYIQR